MNNSYKFIFYIIMPPTCLPSFMLCCAASHGSLYHYSCFYNYYCSIPPKGGTTNSNNLQILVPPLGGIELYNN